jgi:hypothetical protein
MLLGVYYCLSKINSDVYIFNFAYYRPDTLYLREQGCEDPCLFFEAKKGPRAKKFVKHYSADICEVRGSVVVVQTRYGLDGPEFETCCWGLEILSSAHLSIRTMVPTQFPLHWALGLFPWGKAKFNNAWSYTSIPPLCLHSMLLGDLYLYLYRHV